jgi:hypothetical protein
VGRAGPSYDIIDNHEVLTICALSKISFDENYGGIYSKSYYDNASHPDWIMKWDIYKTVVFPHDVKFIQDVYLGDNT